MSDKVTNEPIFETLKRIQETLALHTQYHLETKERLGFLEQQYASISRRVDRIDERLERVEKRLDLVEV
jgi:predicted  nucleic acid-binding Zn-ribbon protein